MPLETVTKWYCNAAPHRSVLYNKESEVKSHVISEHSRHDMYLIKSKLVYEYVTYSGSNATPSPAVEPNSSSYTQDYFCSYCGRPFGSTAARSKHIKESHSAVAPGSSAETNNETPIIDVNPGGPSVSRTPSLPPVPDSFNEELYFEKNPDLKQNGWTGSAWSHYVKHGKAEGRQGDFTPVGWDAQAYLDTYSDVKNNWSGSALSHYLTNGRKEGRRSDFRAAGTSTSKSDIDLTNLRIVRGDGPTSGDDGSANKGNGAAVYVINDRGERFHITSAAAEQMRKNGTWKKPVVVDQEKLDSRALRYDINSASDLKSINSKEITGGFMLVRGSGPTDKAGFVGAGAPVYAVNKKGEYIHVTKEYADQLRGNGGWISPSVIDQKMIDAELKKTGGSPFKKMISDGRVVDIDYKTPQTTVSVAEAPVATEPSEATPTEETEVEQPGDVIEPENTTEEAGEQPDANSDSASTDSNDSPGEVNQEEASGDTGEGESSETGEGQSQTEEESLPTGKGGKGGGAGIGEDEKDEEKQSALAVRRSKDEERLKKIMKQREKWGGASAGSGADSLAAPVVTPASNSQGFGGIPGQR